MAKDQFAELLARMAATGVASADELEGCTAAEIRQLESRYGIRLPPTYRHFRVRAKQFRSSVIGWIRAWADEAAEVVASGWYEVSGGDLPVDNIIINPDPNNPL